MCTSSSIGYVIMSGSRARSCPPETLTIKWNWAVPLDVKLTFLKFVNGESLIQMTNTFGGSILMCKDKLYSSDDVKLQVDHLLPMKKDDYQVIITDDTSMI
jgi:hypothetical protein